MLGRHDYGWAEWVRGSRKHWPLAAAHAPPCRSLRSRVEMIGKSVRKRFRRLWCVEIHRDTSNIEMRTHTQQPAGGRTRYFERATLLIKRAVLMLILAPFLISTHFMLADVMTKPADKGTFVRMRNVMMNVHSGLRNSLVESAHDYMEKLSYLLCTTANEPGLIVGP